MFLAFARFFRANAVANSACKDNEVPLPHPLTLSDTLIGKWQLEKITGSWETEVKDTAILKIFNENLEYEFWVADTLFMKDTITVFHNVVHRPISLGSGYNYLFVLHFYYEQNSLFMEMGESWLPNGGKCCFRKINSNPN